MELAKMESCLKRMTFTFPGHPVAYVRMTRASMWAPTAQNYLGYKKALSEALKKAHPEWIVGSGPDPKTQAKDRKKWVAEQKRFVYELWVTAYVPELFKADTDNLLKTASDGLEYAEILYNDTLVIDCHGSKREDKENPRLEITLERVLR